MIERNTSLLEYAFEGVDGGGKTSNIAILKERFEHKGLEVVVLSGLSKTPFGLAIRRNITLLNSMGVSGMRFFKEDIRRSYESLNGKSEKTDIVFWDRHIYSMAAANIKGCDLGLIREVDPQVPEPSRVFLLDIPPDIAWQREQIVQKNDHILTPEWLVEKYQRYRKLATMEPERFTIIDASQPLDKVSRQLFDIINSDLLKEFR